MKLYQFFRRLTRPICLLLVLITLVGYAAPAVSADILNYFLQEKYKTVSVSIDETDQEIPCPPGYRIYVHHLCGEGTNTHEWYVKRPGASTFKWYSSKDFYSVESFPASSVGSQVYCICTGSHGTAYSGMATLTAMGIYNQPNDDYASVGETVSATVEAAGNGLKYQWYVKDKSQSNFTRSSIKEATYSFKMTSAKSGRQAYCVVTDEYGNKEKSDVVTFRVLTNLKITKQPKDVQVNSKQTASVTVKAEGDGLKYTWYVKDPGKTSFTKSSVKKATYSFKMTTAKSGRQVYCVITDEHGNKVQSDTVTMKLKEKVKITTQPKSVTGEAGTKVSTTVKASGDGLKYQWYVKDPGKSSFTKSSVKKATYSFTLTSAKSGRKAYCVITDKYGNSVKTKTVTLSGKVTLTDTIEDVTRNSYGKVSVKASATGYGLKYQWYLRKTSSGSFSKSSVKSDTYSFTLSSSDEFRQVYCVITDKHGNSVQTRTVTIKYEEMQPEPTDPDDEIDSVLDKDDCMWCRGTGKCRDCGGTGYVYTYKPGIKGQVRERCGCAFGACRWCYGSGKA